MGFTFILLVAPQRFIPALGQVRIALLTAIGAVTVHLVNRFVHRRPLLVFTRELRIVAVLSCWAIVTVPFSYWPGGSVEVLLSHYFKNITVFWLIGETVNSVTRLRQVAWGLSLMAIPAAVAGVGEYLSGNLRGGRIVGFVSPMASNPNDLALLLNLILPFAIALLAINRNTLIRSGLFAILGLDVLAVILTFSRGGSRPTHGRGPGAEEGAGWSCSWSRSRPRRCCRRPMWTAWAQSPVSTRTQPGPPKSGGETRSPRWSSCAPTQSSGPGSA
jgi:hypothetical protein